MSHTLPLSTPFMFNHYKFPLLTLRFLCEAGLFIYMLGMNLSVASSSMRPLHSFVLGVVFTCFLSLPLVEGMITYTGTNTYTAASGTTDNTGPFLTMTPH